MKLVDVMVSIGFAVDRSQARGLIMLGKVSVSGIPGTVDAELGEGAHAVQCGLRLADITIRGEWVAIRGMQEMSLLGVAAYFAAFVPQQINQ